MLSSKVLIALISLAGRFAFLYNYLPKSVSTHQLAIIMAMSYTRQLIFFILHGVVLDVATDTDLGLT